jgi:hypothetical protein
MIKYPTREAWLEAAVTLMTPLFKSAGYEVPKVRVACGWPSARGLSAKKRVLGEAWCKTASSDKVAQIFISPLMDKTVEPYAVLPVLVHEVVHTVVGNKEGHNKVFGKCARAVGLEGKLTSTIAGEKLLEACTQWDKQLGQYPHCKLDQSKRPVNKQTTRMIKCECEECGYVVRTSKKWILEVGAPHCPKHGAMHHDPIEENDEDENED